MSKDDKYIMSSLDNALKVLDLLSKNKELRIIDISNALKINKSSVFKMLYTLERRKYVHKLDNGKYTLGIKFAHYGSIVLDNYNVLKIVRPYLQKLRDEHNETAHLGMLDEDLNLIFMAKEASNASIQMNSRVGSSLPFHVTATGKVIVADNLDEDMMNRLKSYDFIRYTEKSITDYKNLIEALSKIKEQGYGEDLEENEIGLICYAVPIKNITGKTIAAISFSGPVYRVEDKKDILIGSLKKAAKEISGALGYCE